ncbi:MAG: zinc-dependent metalloprotease [Bdellovibrionota bacterium]
MFFKKNCKAKNYKAENIKKGKKAMKHCRKKMLGAILVLMSLVVSCTKEKPYEFTPDKKTISKEMFKKEDFGNLKPEEIAKLSPEEKRKFRVPRIAVMSYGQATRTATASMPYFQGRTKLVEFEISEHEIEVRELEKDPRFAENPTNSKAIMVMPVRHIDYKCERDAYGECQNKEVESVDRPWNERAYAEIGFKDSKILDIDELPVEITNLLSGCYSEGNQKLINYDLDKDVFNFELQKSYTINLSNPACWGEISDFEDLFEKLNFDVRYVYSMVRADKIASKDYKAVQYKTADEETFGFFNSKIGRLDVDNNAIENNDEVLLNRWNPARKVIPYHLSDAFDKAEYGYVLDATRAAVQNVNNGLAEAGTGIEIQLMPPSGKKVGDLRNNMIVLVDDPLASRIIGYGPSVAHPLTGEIVNARTVMYLGTIKGIVKSTYEDMREELMAAKENAKAAEEAGKVGSLAAVVESVKNRLNVFSNGKNMLKGRASLDLGGSALQRSISTVNLADKTDVLQARVAMNKRAKDLSGVKIPDGKIAQIKRDILKFKRLEGASLIAKTSKYIDKRIDVLSKNNVYPEELFNAEHALRSAGIDEKIEGNLKPWAELTSAEREEIVRLVLPHIWIPTLVHELGHNLGLRHNFAGSEDKANFYTGDELKKMGVTHEIPYSSMMEYSYKTTNELPTLGKYDIAALKFAYKREVDAVNQAGAVVKAVKVEKNLAETTKALEAEGLALKEYRYCTDEHVSANPTCNRHDEGTNLVEIATHFISSYEDRYKRINKRSGRKNFSVFQEGAYLGRMSNNFYDLRLTFEVYEKIKNEYGIEEGNPLWKDVDFLREIYEASTLSGQFLLSILLTPDVHCAIAVAQEPRAPVALIQIRNLDPSATTCFHPDVARTVAQIGEQNNLQLVVVGEGGKSFKSRKDPLNENVYADQIDVQGIWIDKMLALEFLFTRELGSSLFDANTQNFLSHGAVGPSIENILAAILLGRGGVEVPFRNAEGFPVEFLGEGGATSSALPISIEFGSDHNIEVPAAGGLSEYFGLPGRQTTFQRELARSLGRLVPTLVGAADARRFLDSFSIYKEHPGRDKQTDVVSVEVGTERYFALKQNKVAVSAIQGIGYAKVLDKVTVGEVEKILEMKDKGEKLPEETPDRIKAAFALDNEVLKAFIDGLIKSTPFYEELLDALLVSVR